MRSTVSATPGVLGRRGDRVRALRLVAVLGGQAHVDVLAGDVAGPVRRRRARSCARARSRPDLARRSPTRQAMRGAMLSRSSSAAPATGRRGCGSRRPPRSRARRTGVSVSPRTHFALFQKYRCGTSSRAGPPCSGSSGSPSKSWATHARPSVTSSSGEVRRVVAVAPGGDVLGLRGDAVEQRVDRHAGPRRAELGPLGHAVDVDGERLVRERAAAPPTSTTAPRRPRRRS